MHRRSRWFCKQLIFFCGGDVVVSSVVIISGLLTIITLEIQSRLLAIYPENYETFWNLRFIAVSDRESQNLKARMSMSISARPLCFFSSHCPKFQVNYRMGTSVCRGCSAALIIRFLECPRPEFYFRYAYKYKSESKLSQFINAKVLNGNFHSTVNWNPWKSVTF